jgi:16S rRNA (guanine(527)-N(7))-methyltransferase RsmG
LRDADSDEVKGEAVVQANWRYLLDRANVPLNEDLDSQLERYVALIRQWNGLVSLVSQGDLLKLEENHIADSLSLVPHVWRACGMDGLLLDVGSGAGFPALVLKMALPSLRVVLVERSDKKVGFLRTAVGTLRLDGVEIRCGEFPKVAEGLEPQALTARAVEKPERVLRDVSRWLPGGCTFLCQLGEPNFGQMFHVEHIEDEWSESGIRRGELYVVSRV